MTNPLGQKILYTPDALDRITQLTDAINGATAFTYDANSNLLTVTDAKAQQTVYTYSTMNRVSTRKDPLPRPKPTATMWPRSWIARVRSR